MAPVGRPISSGRNPFSKDEDCVQIIPQDEIKQEPPDDEGYSRRVVEAIPVKVEEEEEEGNMPTYAAMNGEEGVVLKQEDCSDDEEGKLHMDILDSNSIRSERDDEGEKVSNSTLVDSVPDSGNSLLCKVCGKQFFRMFYFNLHMKTHRSPTVNRSISEKPHTCLECGKSFAFLQHLTGHSRMHIASRYFECPVCRRKFTELSNLSMHLLKTHPDEKPYKCSVCEKQFTQSSALKKHLRIHSNNISPEELDRIDMMFFVNVANGVDVEEPLKKKIKLEVEEGTTYRSIDKSSIKEKIAEPKSKSPLLKEKSVRSPEKEKCNQSSGGREDTFKSFQSNENCREKLLDCKKEKSHVPSQSSPAALVLPPPAEDVQLLAQQVESKESSLRDQSARKESLPEDFSVLSDNTSPHPSKLSSAKESSKVNHGKESIPLKNGVPLEQVKCPQIKVVKFGKTPSDSEPLTVNGQSLNSPLKSISGGNQSNLESVELLKETENSNQPFLYSSDKMQKGRPGAVISVSRTKSDLFVGWEKNESDFREPLPSLEKPDGEYEVKYKCHRCEIFLDSEEKLHDHLMDHTGVKLCECRFCGKDFTTMTSLKRHLYYHVVGLIPQDCTRCAKTFASFRDLKEHCMSKKCDASNSARYKCFRCRKLCPSLKKLKVHLLSQCKDEPTKYFFPKKKDRSNSNDSCENSVNAAKQNDNVEENSDSSKTTCQDEWVSQKFEKVDSNEAGFQDLNCDPKDAEALRILSDLVPEKGKECWHLQCQSCKHNFENAAKAKVHAEVGCGMNGVLTEANTGSESGTHKIKVILEEDENLQCFLNCAECDMKISGVEKMLLHIQEHIYQQNNLICPVLKCEKLFKDPKEFKIHLKAHTGHKPFKCSDCGKRFFLRENYENHAQRHGILKHWNSFSTVFGEKASKKSISARSPITIESSIINLEVSEADVERRAKSTQQQQIKGLDRIKEEENRKPHKKVKAVASKPVVRSSQPSHRPLSLVAKPLTNGKQVLVNQSPPSPLKKPTPPASRPSSLLNRPSPPVGRVSPPISRQSPTVTKSSPPSRTSSPASWYSPPPNVSRPSAVNQTYVHRLPQIVKPAPAVHRQLIPVIRASHSLDIPTGLVNRLPQSIGAPIVNRIIPGHQPGGSLSVTPQGIFTVTPPRTYLSPAASSSIKSNYSVPTSRPSLSPKDPNTRVHPPSYYEITENSRAIIQAANSELKKYPRSGRCEVCKKICSRLDKHMMVHLGHKPHMCPVCPQAFRQSEHLRRHIRARHEGNHRQFECPHCEKRLTRKDKLKEHMKNCQRMITSASPVMNTVSVPRYIGNSLFDMIPGPAHLSSQPPLQGHTTA